MGGVEGVSGFQGVVSVGGTQGVESVGPEGEGEGEGGLGLCGVVSVPGSVGGLVGSKVVCGTGTQKSVNFECVQTASSSYICQSCRRTPAAGSTTRHSTGPRPSPGV